MVAVAELWGVLLFPAKYGAVNSLIGHLGLGPEPFLNSPHQALASVMLVQIWKSAPYDMVIFVAGWPGSTGSSTRRPTSTGPTPGSGCGTSPCPALRPITTIVITLGIIRGLRVFTEVYVLTNGGPAGATETVTTFGYKQATTGNDTGYATAVSTLLLAVTVLITALFLWWRRRREDA